MTLSIECDILFLPLQVIKFLDKHVVPAGVHVVALQGLEWLTACINCHASGSVTIANSKTDYVFLTEAGWQTLQDLKAENNCATTADIMLALLDEIVALLETKTTSSIKSGSPDGHVHQALLEHLAVTHLAGRPGECASGSG